MNKKYFTTSLLLCTMILSGCGSNEKSATFSRSDTAAEMAVNNNEAYSMDEAVEEEYSDGESGGIQQLSNKKNDTSEEVVQKEMLVYSCDLKVDVLDFDDALDSFKKSFSEYGAFVEKENYSDGGNTSRWYDDEDLSWKSYTATVRVPSSDYDNFCDFVSELGYLRSKNANVENLSHEYYDLSSTLDIYEAKEKRYKELLDTITDEAYAIKVENELTDIQVEISRLKTRMNDIKTDVTYSFVYVTINEVREYVKEPVKTDTFSQRFSNTVSEATSGFLNFMEKFLFFVIYVFPYALIICVIAFVIRKIHFIRKNKSVKTTEIKTETKKEEEKTESSEKE